MKVNIYILFFILMNVCFSQENNSNDKAWLESKSYNELSDSFYNVEFNQKKASVFAEAFLSKAKKERNILKIAEGYYFHSYILSNHEDAIKYADSIIKLTKDIEDYEYPAKGYLIKGKRLYDDIGDYEGALNNYLIVNEYALKRNNRYQQVSSKHVMAILKNHLGNEKEALSLYKENKVFLSNNRDNKKYKQKYIVTLLGITDSYLRMRQLDSASYYSELGIKECLNSNNEVLYSFFLLTDGTASYMAKNYKKSIDTLNKAIRILKKDENNLGNLKMGYLYKGKSLLDSGNEEKAIKYFKRIDSLTIEPIDFFPEMRESYELLIDYYKRKNDKENQLVIMERLLYFDNAIKEKYHDLNIKINYEYDRGRLTRERDELIAELKEKDKLSNTLLKLLFVFVIILVLFLIFINRKKKYYRNKFEEYISSKDIEKKEESTKKTISEESQKIGLSEEIIKEIISKLEEFEQEKKFLFPDSTQNNVASSLKTNSTYLSKVVNSIKNKNFTNYINDLRIEYAINELQNNKQFRAYSVKAIAFEIGFKSSQSFSNAFIKKTGIKPSIFINEIKKRNS
ncbi:helix-turn-helix domain-containing protein [uncultured Kordia sp.]|uniref:helix-turn-helix domain-containing protein n=1 Tax=uncultured Kordia sp. TaxID=507699 RepID=UPI00260FD980|nr:helix-turn-helix domain-containing protein [uncultured Kordia sp.]